MSLTDDLAAVHAEGDGVFEVTVVHPEDGPRLFGAAFTGDPKALKLANAVADLLADVARAPRRSPKLCGCCPRAVR